MNDHPVEPLFAHPKGVILGRPFHFTESGDVDVYLIDDPNHLPASEHYFLKRQYVQTNQSRMPEPRWKAYWGPVVCFESLAGGDMREGFEQALAHYSKRTA